MLNDKAGNSPGFFSKFNSLFLRFGSIFCLVSVLIYYTELKTHLVPNRDIFLFAGLFFGYVVLVIWFKKKQEVTNYKKVLNFAVYLFFASLAFAEFAYMGKLPANFPGSLHYLLIYLPLAIGFFIIFYRKDEFSTFDPEKNIKVAPLLAVIILLGFILRFHNIGSFTYYIDEAISGLAAFGLAYHGVPVMPSGAIYSREILTTALISVGVRIFGLNELGLRIVPVIFGTLNILVFYFIGKNLISKKAGLLFSFLIATSILEIVYSRFARMYIFLQSFLALTILFSILNVKTKKTVYWIASVVAALLAFLSQRIGVISIAIPLFTFLFVYKDKLIDLYKNNRKTTATGLIAATTASTVIIFALRSQLKAFFIEKIYGNGSYYNVATILSSPFHSYKLILEEFGPIVITFCILGTVCLFAYLKSSKKWVNVFILFFCICIVPLLIDLAIYSQGYDYRIRYIFFVVPYFVLAATFFVTYLRKIFGSALIVPLSILLFFIGSSFTAYQGYAGIAQGRQNDYPNDFSSGDQKSLEFVARVREILKQDGSVLVGSPPELLMLYFGQPKYWLVSNQDEIGKYSIDGKYQYIDSEILGSLDTLKQIESENKVVVIVMGKDRWQFLNSEIQDYIRLTYLESASYGQNNFDVFIKRAEDSLVR